MISGSGVYQRTNHHVSNMVALKEWVSERLLTIIIDIVAVASVFVCYVNVWLVQSN